MRGYLWFQVNLCDVHGSHLQTFKYRKVSKSTDTLTYDGMGKRMSRNADVIGTQIVPRSIPESNLQNLKGTLGVSETIELGNGICIFAAPLEKEPPWTQIVAFGKMFLRGDGKETTRRIHRYARIIAPRLLATIPLRRVKMRVVGTRVFCYENGISSGNQVVVFDVWNPESVDVCSEDVIVTRDWEKLTVAINKWEKPCVLCKEDTQAPLPRVKPPQHIRICHKCIHSQYKLPVHYT